MLRTLFTNSLVVSGALMLLTACDPSTPSQVKTGQIRIMETTKTATVDVRRVNENQVNVIADDYLRNGKGGISMVMPYLAGGPLNEVEVQRQSLLYKEAFAKRGIRHLQVDVVPVEERQLDDQAVVTYIASVALPPDGCMPITGYNGSDTLENVKGYQMGCEIKGAMSQMIARPEDLMGRAGTPDAEARRQGTMMESHMAGTPRPRMQGMNASTVGSGE